MTHKLLTALKQQARRLRPSTMGPVVVLGALMVLSACGGVNESDAAGSRSNSTAEVSDAPEQTVRFEEPRTPGEHPFTVSVVTPDADVAENTDEAERVEIGPGLYGGTGDQQICDRELLAASLEAQPDKAAAWADVTDIDVDEIGEFVNELTPAVLARDTRVTNHGYRDGQATPFQSTLGRGTAVLVDADGEPVTRCACGNPLAAPIDGDPVDVDVVPETPSEPGDEPAADDGSDGDEVAPAPTFCAVLASVSPSMSGGPAAPGVEALQAYLVALSGGLDSLIISAEATPGFPADALADLVAYDESIEAAIAAGGIPGPGDVALRDRVELFLATFCDDESPETPGAADDVPEDDTDEDEPSSGNCGSMQFFLLIAAADGLSLDHSAVSTDVLEAMNDVLAGADPGEEFDVGDLAPMLAYEEVGCQGAQAMQQLFEDNGLGHLIEGTELGA